MEQWSRIRGSQEGDASAASRSVPKFAKNEFFSPRVAQPTQLCEILQMDASTVSRHVDRMQAKGWLETMPGEDARTQPLRLTTRGVRLLEKAFPAWQEAHGRTKELLGREGATLLEKTVRKVGGPLAP